MSERAEVLAKVLAEHSPFADHPGTIYPVHCGCSFGPDRTDLPAMGWLDWNAHVAAALDAALAAQEGERGGAAVAAAVEAVLAECRCTLQYPGFDRVPFTSTANCWAHGSHFAGLRKRLAPALADSGGVLRQHDAEVLRAAADRMPAFHDRDVPEWAITSACKWLRERADRIAGDQP